jgi:hypothetical protein
MPGRPLRPTGLLANLQETRATRVFLIECNDDHGDILGETIREIKQPKYRRAVLSLNSGANPYVSVSINRQ